MFSGAVTHAQQPVGPPNSTQLTTEQNAALTEARQLSQRVVQLHGSGRFDEALPLARRALELRQSVLANTHALVADSLINLAGLHLAKQEHERAESLFKQALSIYDNANFVSPPSANALQTLTYLCWRAGDYDKAEIYGKRAIVANEKVYGVNSSKLLDPLQNLIRVYNSNRDIEKTEPLYQRIVSLAENNKEKLSSDLAQLLATYRCSHLELNRTANLVAIDRRIEELLGSPPATQQNPLPGGILNGRALSLPKPPYPVLARHNRAAGPVVVKVEIDECGRVVNAEAVSGAIELRQVSVDAARRARFSPTLMGRVPVRINGSIHYNFVYPAPIR